MIQIHTLPIATRLILISGKSKIKIFYSSDALKVCTVTPQWKPFSKNPTYMHL